MKQAQRFTVLRGWKLIMRDMGIPVAHVLRRAALPEDLFARSDATLSAAEYFALWQALEDEAGGDTLPLRIGQAISVEAFDPPIFACLCSADLNQALPRLAGFKRLIGPLTLALESTPQATHATFGCYGHAGPLPRSLGATELVFLTQLARLATRQRIVPLRLELPAPPQDAAPYTAFFGSPIQTGPAPRISFAAADASLPFLTEDAAMWGFFAAGLQQRLADLDAQAGMAERVKSALLDMLPAGQGTMEQVAARLTISKRSLQRHLGTEGLCFQDVLNQTRHELARHYLQHSQISPGEISWLLGFQDGNSFIRAFKSWSGRTPGEWRQLHAPA
ncbi:AraC family transcriptional regulator ligand-binding domain-containing protein [Massilia sp. W12]|uniref:AraC family transcriptional regulator n=1 Tax=Massilia sp. W12 TaxID=3126507 RepID=UPI0030D62C44